eukprot:XP_001701702.1 predicted protein [Chlamydomonas reinhardtii]
MELTEKQRLPCNISILNDYMHLRDRHFSYKQCGFASFTLFCKWFEKEGWLSVDQERSSVVISRTKFEGKVAVALPLAFPLQSRHTSRSPRRRGEGSPDTERWQLDPAPPVVHAVAVVGAAAVATAAAAALDQVARAEDHAVAYRLSPRPRTTGVEAATIELLQLIGRYFAWHWSV